MGHYLCAQWESILGAPWEINGVHIVVGVNNIPNIRSTCPSKVLSHMNLMCGFCMEGWNELRSL